MLVIGSEEEIMPLKVHGKVLGAIRPKFLNRIVKFG
jgi:hypothetical protein